MTIEKITLERLNRLSEEEYAESQKFPLVIVLDNIRSAHNVGSLFRTCDALNVEKILLCGYTPTPPHKEITKTALGSASTVRWEYYQDAPTALSVLKDKGYTIASLEQTTKSIMIQTVRIQGPIALVLGNEVDGVSQIALELSDMILEIPQYGTKHSFNVSIAGGIALWELLRQSGYI